MTHLEMHVNQRIHPGQYVIIVLEPMGFVNSFVYHACSVYIVHAYYGIVSSQVREPKQQPQ